MSGFKITDLLLKKIFIASCICYIGSISISTITFYYAQSKIEKIALTEIPNCRFANSNERKVFSQRKNEGLRVCKFYGRCEMFPIALASITAPSEPMLDPLAWPLLMQRH
jgi:hypothetical protein